MRPIFVRKKIRESFFLALVGSVVILTQTPSHARAAPGDIVWIRQFGSPLFRAL